MSIQVVGTGYTVLDRIYADADAVTSEELGGTCGNVLISLAMLSRRVAPVLSLGEDEVGGRLLCAFDHAGAETRFIRRHAGRLQPATVSPSVALRLMSPSRHMNRLTRRMSKRR